MTRLPPGFTVDVEVYLTNDEATDLLPAGTDVVVSLRTLTVLPDLADPEVAAKIASSAIAEVSDLSEGSWRLMTPAEMDAYQKGRTTPYSSDEEDDDGSVSGGSGEGPGGSGPQAGSD